MEKKKRVFPPSKPKVETFFNKNKTKKIPYKLKP